jgi:ADP-heptose:LPS heptosyltransferase
MNSTPGTSNAPAVQGQILVIRGGAIGDFILTLPVLAALRRAFPGTRLELLAYPQVARLALAGGLVDGVTSMEGGALAGFFAAEGRLDAGLRNYFSRFAIVVSYLYDPDLIFQTNVARCATAQFIAGPHRPDTTANLHATQALLKPLERLAIFDADAQPRLTLGNRVVDVVPSRPLLALHPGSGSESKNWPESRWAELLGALLARSDLDLLLVGGEAEGRRLERLAAPLPTARVSLARNLPLTELAGRLINCAGFVGHDSGISHLAAALGLPTLILWGPSPEAVWRPPGDHVRVLRHARGLHLLPPAEALAAVADLLGARGAAPPAGSS